jgi:DICT domain-containing protein
VAPQHALAGLVAALVISMLDMVIFAFQRQRLYSELAWRTILRGRR